MFVACSNTLNKLGYGIWLIAGGMKWCLHFEFWHASAYLSRIFFTIVPSLYHIRDVRIRFFLVKVTWRFRLRHVIFTRKIIHYLVGVFVRIVWKEYGSVLNAGCFGVI